MRADAIAAERAAEVRAAGRAWRRAGFIDDQTLGSVVAAFPDDRTRFGPGFRTLAFIFTGVAVMTAVGLSMTLWRSASRDLDTLLLFFWAFVMAGLTELQLGPLKRAASGSESATALLSIAIALFGTESLNQYAAPMDAIVFLTCAFLLCTLAAWRWGGIVFFLGAALSGYGLLAQAEGARLLWIVASLGLIPACVSAARDRRRLPSHRTGAMLVGAVAVLALYGAVHVWSSDQGLVEAFRSGTPGARATGDSVILRWLSIAATAFLPIGLLGAGWRRREPLLLYAGLMLLGVSIVTLKLYYSIMPLSFALILVGTACLSLALGARRWLRSGESGERNGFTADPLFDNANRTQAIRSVVAVVSFTPAGVSPGPSTRFQGGGGRSGGGGASGEF